ncbi:MULTISPECIES: hypothetical protein [Oxalobacteraceae]|uniref:hypothetical protein n=1 Tax=Herminiimonas sp. Marseille-P9896 TaxID=2742211 RepID=UPI00158A0CFD|nr:MULTISPECIES: hypothetical protein [Oxalobacteraceae]
MNMPENFLRLTQVLRDGIDASNLEMWEKVQGIEVLDSLDFLFRSGLATKAVTTVLLDTLPPLPNNAATAFALTGYVYLTTQNSTTESKQK